MDSSVKLVSRGKTLAELQEDMKNDFQTQTMQKAQEVLQQKKKRSRKDALDASMRLTGGIEHQPKNRHQIDAVAARLRSAQHAEKADARRSSSVPLRQGGRGRQASTTRVAIGMAEANETSSHYLAATMSDDRQSGWAMSAGGRNQDLGLSQS